MIKAIIFDLDGTLYDYNSCNIYAEKKLLQAVSSDFNISENLASQLLKNAKAEVKRVLGCEVAASHNRLLYMQNICEQIGKNPLVYAMKFYDVYWDAMLERMELYDYVKPLFEELGSRKIKIGVLTDLTAHIQYRKIIKLGIAEYIDALVTSEEAGAEKPSEKMFLLILKKLGVLPAESLMLGDSRRKDFEGAVHLGMNAIQFCKDKNIIKLIEEVI